MGLMAMVQLLAYMDLINFKIQLRQWAPHDINYALIYNIKHNIFSVFLNKYNLMKNETGGA